MACKLSDLAERNDPSYMDDKRAASQDEFVLERVQGLTSTTLQSLASNPVTGWVAFPAACVLVLLDPKTNEQKFIESPSLRNISCCSFTDDGRFVAFGETGMKPHIAMWNLREHKECHKFVADTTVRAIFFHPTSPIIISLSMKESLIVVWDYVKGMRMASCKWQTMPLSLTIPRTGSSLVVCGHRKITLFNISKVDSRSYETNVFEDRKTVLLGKQSEYTFVDIVSGRGKHERTVYTVTSCGYLCEVKLGDILIDKAIKVDTQTFCVRYSTELLFVGCPAGVVKICDPDNLTVTAAVSLSSLLGPSVMPKVGSKGYIDVCTLVVDENEKIVTCVYADCSMHSWQIGTDGQKIVCSAIEPGTGSDGTSGHPASKSNLLRAFIGCCEKSKGGTDFLTKFSLTDQNKPPIQFGGRRLVNENRASYQNVNAVRFTPDGKDVICGNEEGEIKVYELATGILRRVIEAHSSQVTCIELMYDSDFQLVCSGGRDRVMFVLDARTDFSLVQVLCDHSAAITAISLVSNKGVLTLVSAAADNVILIRRAILGGTLRFTITGEIAQTNCNRSFFVTSDYIALGGKDSQIKVFKADPVFVSKPVKTINCQKLCPTSSGFKAIDIDPSSSFMAVSQANGNISVYHLQTGQPVASLPLQSDITNIQFTADLKYMVSSTSNGCDLVWRLPERMTDFMRSKQEKTYQIETNKEVTYETYMSCVKVCKKEEDDDDSTDQQNQHHQPSRRQEKRHQQQQQQQQRRANSRSGQMDLDEEGLHRGHIAQNSSNHNSEWDRTPSIDSMSMLDHYSGHVMRGGQKVGGSVRGSGGRRRADGRDDQTCTSKSRGCSSCGSGESVMSCSTCTQSVSTTTHTSCCSAAVSDSSVSTQDGLTGVGKGQHLRFYCGVDHELFGQVIDEGRCIKVGPFREKLQNEKQSKDSSQKGNNATAPPLLEKEKQNASNGGHTMHCKDSVENAGAGEKAQQAKTNGTDKNATADSTVEVSPHVDNTLKERDGETSEEVVIRETLITEEISECNDAINFRERRPLPNLPLHTPQDVSQNSDRTHVITPPLHEPRFPKSRKILEKAIFYEGVMKGDLKSARLATLKSPTRQETTAIKEAVRSASQRRASPPCDSGTLNKDMTNAECLPEATVSAEVEDKSPRHWTPLTTPEYSNTSSNITNLVPSSSSTLVDLCNSTKMFPEAERIVRRETSLERLARDRRCSPTPNVSGNFTPELIPQQNMHVDGAEIRPGSDSTQGDGESFRSDFEEESVSAVDYLDKLDVDIDTYSYNALGRDEHGRLRCVTKTDTNLSVIVPANKKIATHEANTDETSEVPESKNTLFEVSSTEVTNSEVPVVKTEDDIPDEKIKAGNLVHPRHKDEFKQKDEQTNKHIEERHLVLEQLEQDGFAVPEKYHNALRSCMQLSNSQETFATLRVDTNDIELMAFLSHALKRKLVAAGLVGLSCNEIDTLLNSTALPTATVAANAVEVKTTAVKTEVTGTEATHYGVEIDPSLVPGEGEPTQSLAVLENTLQNKCEKECSIGDHTLETAAVKMPEEAIRIVEPVAIGEACCGEKPINTENVPVPEVQPQKSPGGEHKKRTYKSILSRLTCARKSLMNRSANRSNTESQLFEELCFESEKGDLAQEGAYLEMPHQEQENKLILPDTSLTMDSIEKSQLSPTIKGFSKIPTGVEDTSDSAKNLTVEQNELKELDTTHKNLSSFVTGKPAADEKAKDSSSANTGGLRRLPAPSASTDSPVAFHSARRRPASPWRDQCLSEGRGLRELQAPDGRSRPASSCSQAVWRLSQTSTCERESEESIHSKAESLGSTVSKDVSVHQCSESDSGVDAESSHREKPMAEMFRDQDEYLRKLKEVRENFERSIQALSAERKSRQAAADERGKR